MNGPAKKLAFSIAELISRTARKAHKCQVARRAYVYAPRVCAHPVIAPGERYVDYVGESNAYESGIAFCEACARVEWADYVVGDDGLSPDGRLIMAQRRADDGEVAS